jgi:hypothetical protein
MKRHITECTNSRIERYAGSTALHLRGSCMTFGCRIKGSAACSHSRCMMENGGGFVSLDEDRSAEIHWI